MHDSAGGPPGAQASGASPGTPKTTPPSRGWYLFAALLFFGSLGGGLAIVVGILLTSLRGGEPFLVPGTKTLELSQPGTYGLWYDHQTLFGGRVYHFEESLPNGLRVRITERGSGREIPLEQGLGGSETVGTVRRTSVGEFKVSQPGPVQIEVTGPFEARVFSVRRSLMGRFFLGVFALIGLNLAGWIGAPAVAVVAFLARRRAGASW